MNQIVSLEIAKFLKLNGYNKTTEWFYLDKNLAFCPAGLKKTKNDKKINHNKYDEFIYSAPTNLAAIIFLNKHKIHKPFEIKFI